MTMVPIVIPLSPQELAEYGAERIRNDAFDQVLRLWDRRKSEGWTQRRLADAIGRDPGWVSRNLSAPGNWTLRTIGAFVQGLNGEAFLHIYPLEESKTRQNFDAYDGYGIAQGDEGDWFKRYTVDPPQETRKVFQSEPKPWEYAK